MGLIVQDVKRFFLSLQTLHADFRLGRSPLALVAVLVTAAGCSFGQDTISLSSGYATVGSSVSLGLTLSIASGSGPAALEFTYAYSTSDFTSVSLVAGPAAMAAGKSVACNGSSGSYTCLVYGMNNTTLTNGIVATAIFTVSPTTRSQSSSIQVINSMGAMLDASSVSVHATGGQVTISPQYTVTALTCAPVAITTPGSAICTVTASAPAPSQGLTVTTASSSSLVIIPSSVAIGAGATTATFTASAAAVAGKSTAVLSASLNGGSQSFTLTLAPPSPPTVTSFSCTPNSVTGPGAATCTVGLSVPAPGAGATVALSGGTTLVSIPSSVSVAAGSTTVAFTASVTAVTASTTDVLSASLNGTSQTFALMLAPPASATLAGFSCTPTSPSKTQSLCTITLSSAAPSGGASVAIQMMTPAPLRAPDSVLLHEGSTSAQFHMKTVNVTTSYQVTLQASLNGSSVTSVVTVAP